MVLKQNYLIYIIAIGLGFLAELVEAQTYQNPIARQQKGGMQISEVIVSDSQTVVKAFCLNDNYRPSALISTAPPGNNNAFRLIANQRFYAIKDVKGIPFSPKSLTLNFGDTVHFDLTFEPIPKNTKIIDLVEGAASVENAWMIYGLQLHPTFSRHGSLCMFNDEQSFKNYFKKNSLRLWEVEGFWEIEAYYANKKNSQEEPCFEFKEVAVVRENNIFCVYNMKGEKLNMSFKHYRRERYVFSVAIKGLYPMLRTFKMKGDAMKFDLKLPRRQLKALKLEERFKGKVYHKTKWKKLWK